MAVLNPKFRRVITSPVEPEILYFMPLLSSLSFRLFNNEESTAVLTLNCVKFSFRFVSFRKWVPNSGRKVGFFGKVPVSMFRS